jgi:hypothetical protein
MQAGTNDDPKAVQHFDDIFVRLTTANPASSTAQDGGQPMGIVADLSRSIGLMIWLCWTWGFFFTAV